MKENVSAKSCCYYGVVRCTVRCCYYGVPPEVWAVTVNTLLLQKLCIYFLGGLTVERWVKVKQYKLAEMKDQNFDSMRVILML